MIKLSNDDIGWLKNNKTMKFEFNEHKNGINIALIPETPKEMSELARYANNAKSKPPMVWMTFSENPRLSISLDKVSEKRQKGGIGNY